jgi:hypothetical protein
MGFFQQPAKESKLAIGWVEYTKLRVACQAKKG